ncbi:DUF2306 domain-containing protein [Phenylobacterium sp.]|uniref:DUF2306 domain-containing protein n=1 Tax=Phenylobacterium sp. TaxID=1871053 RepID=UPI003BAAE430
MSQVSQISGPERTQWVRRAALVIGVLALVVTLAPYAGGMVRMAARGHLHAPDLPLLAAQPLVIKLHIAGAVASLLIGALLMTQRKGAIFHRTAGWLWVAAMSLVAGSSIFITGLNGDHWSLIHLFTGWTLIALPIAVIAARRHVVKTHRRFMMGLFYGGLVINGFIAFIPGRTMWNLFFA